MLSCICVKEGADETSTTAAAAAAATPASGRSIGAQLKDMVLKLSGAPRASKEDQAVRATAVPAFRPPAAAARDAGSCAAAGDGAREWVAQVEPGVQISFVALAGGNSNDLKRIRFSRELFDKQQAQRWWGENYDRIMELYNVRRFSCQALPTPPRSDDGEMEGFYSQVGSTKGSPWGPSLGGSPLAVAAQQSAASPASSSTSALPDPWSRLRQCQSLTPEAPRSTAASDAASAGGNPSEADATEWVLQDEPGVYVTIRELADGTRELRRVRFSRERFAEQSAKLWWEMNKERIQSQYL